MFRIEDIKTAEMLEQERYESECENVRAKRDRLLTQTDWTQTVDNPLAGDEGITAYRQALRDIPDQAGFPWDVEWPTL